MTAPRNVTSREQALQAQVDALIEERERAHAVLRKVLRKVLREIETMDPAEGSAWDVVREDVETLLQDAL